MFNNVGDEKITLADIKPTGYYNNEDFLSAQGTEDDFAVMILTSNGGDGGVYSWYHYNDGTATGWDEVGEWDGELDLAPGQGLWFRCNVWEEGYGFQSAGDTLVEARNVPLRYGFSPICIPLARAVELAEIHPAGYYENEDFLVAQGTEDDFAIMILTSNGGDGGVYSWYHYNDGTATGWDEVGEWDGECTFQMGDGIWARANVWEEGYTLSFPGLEDTAE